MRHDYCKHGLFPEQCAYCQGYGVSGDAGIGGIGTFVPAPVTINQMNVRAAYRGKKSGFSSVEFIGKNLDKKRM